MHIANNIILSTSAKEQNIKHIEYVNAPIVRYGFLCILFIGNASEMKPNNSLNDQGSVANIPIVDWISGSALIV